MRERAGLTQRELAKRAGVTNATISLIEQEAHAPSLASLHRILSAIPISIADFFALPTSQRTCCSMTAPTWRWYARRRRSAGAGSERRDKMLQLFIERYQPGAGTGGEPISHDGETAAFVIRRHDRGESRRSHPASATGGGYQSSGSSRIRLAQRRQDRCRGRLRLHAADVLIRVQVLARSCGLYKAAWLSVWRRTGAGERQPLRRRFRGSGHDDSDPSNRPIT